MCSRPPRIPTSCHFSDSSYFTTRLQNVWSSKGQQRGLTHFQPDKKGSSTPSKESPYLISQELIAPLPRPPFKFHLASFDLETRVSLDRIFNTFESISIYTDGSKRDDRTGCAFCVRENNISTSEWIAQLKPRNSVFQAELIATKEACTWASQSNQPFKICTDSKTSLHSISSLKTNSPLAQHIQSILLNFPNIKLGYIKAHVGYAGNEAADLLAKKASSERIPTQYPAPKSFLKKKLHAISTQLWQNEWDNGETGRNFHLKLLKVKTSPATCQRPEIMLATGQGPFPIYFKRFDLRTTECCSCGELGTPLHFATSCRLASSYHFTKPSSDLEHLWWKRVLNDTLSRIQIRKLINFMLKNEDNLFPPN
ncbi:hypothetical protein AVEN_259753-1 [Araneus ventricosus]|uniref:RNase H type-1 domain-containing protein n=1 Tax=Araneus ventricosus TaxID=182803 RepID=A0A4Y2D2R6_ARAVE|nr:hypothetical protein AVEN_259753-1 [Araneus ventricosus]